MKKVMALLIVLMMVFIGLSVVVQAKNEQKMYGRIGFFKRIRNRFRDLLGICKGDSSTLLQGTLGHGARFSQINGTELHFGANWYQNRAISAYDYDRDGTNEKIIHEIEGLFGETVSVEGCLQSEGWISVYKINGIKYREPGQPIWKAEHQL
jgi:hypothetical protein